MIHGTSVKSIYRKFINTIFRIEYFTLAAALIILSLILFKSPITGVANNGDYERIMKPAGLEFIIDNRFVNLDQYFKINDTKYEYEPGNSFINSHLLPVAAAKLLNEVRSSKTIFDIRYLGVVYTFLFAIGIFLIVKYGKTRSKSLNMIFALLLVLVFCDVGYIAYFNSFLGEAAIVAFFLLLAGIMAVLVKRGKITVLLIFFLLLASVLFISAKQSNVPMGIFISLFMLSLIFIDRRPKAVITLAAAAILLTGVTFFLYKAAPVNMEKITKHQTVFYGILKDSPTPEEDLEFLGLPKSLAILKESSFFDAGLPISTNSDIMEKEFYNKVNFGTVLKFYLLHPSRFMEKLEVTAANSTMIRPPYLGNFKYEDTGDRLSFSSRFSLWSTWKKTYMPPNLPFTVAFFALFLLVLILEYINAICVAKSMKTVIWPNMFLLLWIIAASQFVIPVIGDGEVDIAKHMFSYNLCFDSMFITAVVWFLSKAAGLIKRYRDIIFKKRVLTAGLILICSITTIFAAIYLYTDNRNGRTIAPPEISSAGIGDFIKFGKYNGEDITWQVINKKNSELTLIADKVISFKSFDAARTTDVNPERQKYGSNNWETSALRTWLNSSDRTVDYGRKAPNKDNVWKGINSYADEPGFLYGFTEDERNAVVTVKHKSIISTFDLDLKTGGNAYYFWSNSVPLLVQNYNNAYYSTIEDKVFLPDVNDLKNYIYDKGLEYRKKPTEAAAEGAEINAGKYAGYWLGTPYANRASFVRYVGSDGYVYHKDAYYGKMGVLPVICIDTKYLPER